jgi:pyruvate-ferredoxin/flavodoxin oxidoreductase
MIRRRAADAAPPPAPKYPGVPAADDGSAAVVEMETAASEAAGAYPITPSTQMGEGFALAVAQGRTNANGRRLLFFEPEGEHAAAAVTAGFSMSGLRATNFSSAQGVAYMHESLYAAVGKRLTYVLNVACRAMTKHALNVHAGHDDYHAIDDTGFFQLFAKNVQEVADLNLIAHRVAELSLNPGVLAQDGFLTSHVIESFRLPERALVKEFLGDPDDEIESPTPAQRLVFGAKRRRIPRMFDHDYPTMLGVVQNQEAYAQGVAAQRPFYFDHVAELSDRALAEYAALTGRSYARASGYRLEDAEWVIAGQGSVVWNAEAVADHLRETRGLRVGVLNLTMFRPFPADLVTQLLRGKKAVTVLERVDQPLAVDAPLLREIRAAAGKALENGRARGELPYPGVAPWRPEDAPDFHSGCFGLGSRDLQPGDLVAAVENMLPGARQRRQFYLSVDFVRPGTHLPKLEIWQQQLLESYPHLAELALRPAADVNLLPPGSTSLRIHSVGGWGAITMGKNLALTAAELLGLHVKANPKYGSEKKGQPTTFYATLAPDPIRLNCELQHVDVVLAPDPNVFRHGNPLAGLADGGVFVIQSDQPDAELWRSLPQDAEIDLRTRRIRLFALDAFAIAADEAHDQELRYRMQGAAFMGAFFRVAPLIERAGLDRERLFAGIRAQLEHKFGKLGERVLEDNLRVIRRGFDEVRELDVSHLRDAPPAPASVPHIPAILDRPSVMPGLGDPGRFWEQVCHVCKTGEDGIADPFAATSVMPAATSSIRDMTDVRFEVPDFVAEKCTGCSQCWTECPDAAIPGLVSELEDVIRAAIETVEAEERRSLDRLRQAVPHLEKEARQRLRTEPYTGFADVLAGAFAAVAPRLAANAERRAELEAQFEPVRARLAEFPLARTAPFFDAPERRQAGSGGLLSITVNPQTCKGCNLCVAVCPEGALVTLRQDEAAVARLRRNWALWERLPDTPDRYVQVSDLEHGVGVLSSLLLKRENYRSMVGGDGACMGCGEKTVVHLVLSTVNSLMRPRVEAHVEKLDRLIGALDAQARQLIASEADLDAVSHAAGDHVDLPLSHEKHERLDRISRMIRDLRDLRWRYTEGPSGQGRALSAFANATGCSSVWGSTWPYNPYPFPWVNHLFQDAPSIAVGLFEAQMQRMADGLAAVRRAELQVKGEYDPALHEPFFAHFDWGQFSDEEFDLCPPLFAVGGDGAMFDIGFQNLSRLMASGKPVRVIVLDTQVYSNTGGQACTSGFFGQVSDMAAFGAEQHGKGEIRKELALIAMAHRGTFVLQSSAALPSHLIRGVIRGLHSRRPAIFILHCPCPPEHGISDQSAARAAKLALESRAFPLLQYDPDAGKSWAECLSLDGNPAVDEIWPSYEFGYVDEAGQERKLELPYTLADWTATEGRFRKHFRPAPPDADPEELVPFHEFLLLSPEQRQHRTPFIYTSEEGRRLGRLLVDREIVRLGESRMHVWSHLRQLAGLELPEAVRERLRDELEQEFEARAAELRAEYEGRLADLRGAFQRSAAEFLGRVQVLVDLPGEPPPVPGEIAAAPPTSIGVDPAAPAPELAVEEAPGLALAPYIESEKCTSCDECINLSRKLFGYDEKRHAFIKDPKAGSFRELVLAAERCPAGIIHPGTPQNPREKGLEEWIRRAERFS